MAQHNYCTGETMKAFPTSKNALSFEKGMDLRDWFAGLTMQAIISRPVSDPKHADDYAKLCYEMADKMMKARDDNNEQV